MFVCFICSTLIVGAIDAVNIANRTIFGTESSQLSCLFWFAYISAADGIIKLCEAKEFTAQESTIKVRKVVIFFSV